MSPRSLDHYLKHNYSIHFYFLSAIVLATTDEQHPFLCNNISLGLMGASPPATNGIGRYVVCDVTDLNLLWATTVHYTAWN